MYHKTVGADNFQFRPFIMFGFQIKLIIFPKLMIENMIASNKLLYIKINNYFDLKIQGSKQIWIHTIIVDKHKNIDMYHQNFVMCKTMSHTQTQGLRWTYFSMGMKLN